LSITGSVFARTGPVRRRKVCGAYLFIIDNAIANSVVLKAISFTSPSRTDDPTKAEGDDAHGETAYAIGAEGE
jgi:hypothetical protein